MTTRDSSSERAAAITSPRSTGKSTAVALLLFLVRNRVLVIFVPILAGLVAFLLSFFMPNWYTATTKILPPQQAQSSAAAVLGQLSLLAGNAGQGLSLKNPNDIYVAILKSRTLADILIQRFDLLKLYGLNNSTDTRRELGEHSIVTTGRDGVITVAVEDKDPHRAAELANGYIDALRTMTAQLAVSEASQRRLFFEGQLQKAKDDLTNAEMALKTFTQQARLASPQGQVSLSLSAAASLRAQIEAREIQVSAMRVFATENNPELARLQKELTALRIQLVNLDNNAGAGKGDVMVALGKAPEVTMEYVRRMRDLKYYETLFEILSKQYEAARIDEAKQATLVQVMDMAIPPEKRSSPRRSVIFLLTTMVAAFAGCLATVAKHTLIPILNSVQATR